jgi:hypothetical protein
VNSMDGNALSGLTSLSGNFAIDVAVLILALATIGHFVRGSCRHLYTAQKKKTKLIFLRKTLELKSVEVATLRATLMQMRKESGNDSDHSPRHDPTSELTGAEGLSSQETQPKEGLPAASPRPSDRYDA